MRTIISFAINPRIAAAFILIGGALTGCSSVKSISPFTSNVPYAQDINPTIARPANPEIPVYKASPQPAPAPKPAVTPPPEPAQPASPPPSAPATPAPAAPAPPGPAPVAPGPQSSIAPAAASAIAEAAKPSAPQQVAQAEAPAAANAAAPSVPAEHSAFKDEGTYPNLAQVPSRPVNMPTFLEAAALEKSLVAEREKAKDPSPDSAAAPNPDSAPVKEADLPKPAIAAAAPALTPVVARTEDGSPCLSEKPVRGDATATLRFDRGSSALTTDDLQVLADSLPNVRSSKGTIRILGHGDTEPGASQAAGRFDLAVSRAGAVAQALAGFGIPTPRMAVGVACTDAAMAGASVQLYAES